MRWFIRLFFRTLRLVLGPFMLIWEFFTTPTGVHRSPQAQRQVDEETRTLVLYQFATCPFCIKVRREIRRFSLKITLRDARNDPEHREALLHGGGEIKVPCLRIGDPRGNPQWLYESDAIIAYLRSRFDTPEPDSARSPPA